MTKFGIISERDWVEQRIVALMEAIRQNVVETGGTDPAQCWARELARCVLRRAELNGRPLAYGATTSNTWNKAVTNYGEE